MFEQALTDDNCPRIGCRLLYEILLGRLRSIATSSPDYSLVIPMANLITRSKYHPLLSQYRDDRNHVVSANRAPS